MLDWFFMSPVPFYNSSRWSVVNVDIHEQLIPLRVKLSTSFLIFFSTCAVNVFDDIKLSRSEFANSTN